jgi:hypothetical protein
VHVAEAGEALAQLLVRGLARGVDEHDGLGRQPRGLLGLGDFEELSSAMRETANFNDAPGAV